MKINWKEKKYNIKSIRINVSLKHWYFYEKWNEFEVDEYNQLGFAFLCFILFIVVYEKQKS